MINAQNKFITVHYEEQVLNLEILILMKITFKMDAGPEKVDFVTVCK